MLKPAFLALATVMAVNVIATASIAREIKPQKPIEMPPIVVKGERPK